MERARLHPLVMAASVAALLFSMLGIAAITGNLPSAVSRQDDAPKAEALQAAQAAKAIEIKTAKPEARQPVAQKAARCTTCGVVESVRAEEIKGEGTGVGAVAGGVAGAVIGNQFGRGTGRKVMTVAGAAGGALAGNEIEKHVKARTLYHVTVRMEDGSVRSLTQSAAPEFGIGTRVRIRNGALERA